MKFKKGELAFRYVLDRRGRIVEEEIVTITDVYSDMANRYGPYPELYEITRPSGEVARGLLPHGLNKVN